MTALDHKLRRDLLVLKGQALAILFSGLVVRRKLDGLDLVAVLKSRD